MEVSVVSWFSFYIVRILMEKTSSTCMYLNVKLNDAARIIWLLESSFLADLASKEYRTKSDKRGAQLVLIGIPVVCWNGIFVLSYFSIYNITILVFSINDFKKIDFRLFAVYCIYFGCRVTLGWRLIHRVYFNNKQLIWQAQAKHTNVSF